MTLSCSVILFHSSSSPRIFCSSYFLNFSEFSIRALNRFSSAIALYRCASATVSCNSWLQCFRILFFLVLIFNTDLDTCHERHTCNFSTRFFQIRAVNNSALLQNPDNDITLSENTSQNDPRQQKSRYISIHSFSDTGNNNRNFSMSAIVQGHWNHFHWWRDECNTVRPCKDRTFTAKISLKSCSTVRIICFIYIRAYSSHTLRRFIYSNRKTALKYCLILSTGRSSFTFSIAFLKCPNKSSIRNIALTTCIFESLSSGSIVEISTQKFCSARVFCHIFSDMCPCTFLKKILFASDFSMTMLYYTNGKKVIVLCISIVTRQLKLRHMYIKKHITLWNFGLWSAAHIPEMSERLHASRENHDQSSSTCSLST